MAWMVVCVRGCVCVCHSGWETGGGAAAREVCGVLRRDLALIAWCEENLVEGLDDWRDP